MLYIPLELILLCKMESQPHTQFLDRNKKPQVIRVRKSFIYIRILDYRWGYDSTLVYTSFACNTKKIIIGIKQI